MNDRFKFRVWDKPLEKYMEFKEFRFMNVEFTFNPTTKEAEIEYDKERYIVEQCTGLKDKKGNLIYEGDILKGSNGSINGQEWEFTHVVKWNDKSHRIVLPDFEPDEGWSHYYNVIGNIHENKELLDERI